MRIHFYDDKDESIHVTDYQGQKLKHAIAGGAQWVEIDGTMYAVKSIKKIASDKSFQMEQPQLTAPTIELTDEQRERNIERLQKMKAEFLAKRNLS